MAKTNIPHSTHDYRRDYYESSSGGDVKGLLIALAFIAAMVIGMAWLISTSEPVSTPGAGAPAATETAPAAPRAPSQ